MSIEKYHPQQYEKENNSEEQATREQQKEALKRTLDHIQYARMERSNLPQDISKVIELLCLAQESLIKEQQKSFNNSNKWDKGGDFQARSRSHLKEQAIHQVEKALEKLKEDGDTDFIDIEARSIEE